MKLSSLFSSARSPQEADAARAEGPMPAGYLARPDDSQLDLFGLTHPGKVRTQNQDHFLVCTIHPQVVVHGTSLPSLDQLPLRGQRLATLLLVAHGVGGQAGGDEASRVATET